MTKLSLFLCVCILCSLIIGCSDNSGNDNTADTNLGEAIVSDIVEETLHEPDTLPLDLNFNGAVVKVFWWEEIEEFKTEFDGDIVNDALYLRDKNVEDRLNVTIQNIPMSYTWDTRALYIDSIRATVLSDDNSKDIVSGQYATMPALVPEGFLLNLAALPYLNFDKPWWVQGLIEETTIDGKLYLVSGNYTTQAVKAVYAMYFNKVLHENFGMENMYTIVHDGKWTIDKMKELINDTYADINGDGVAGMEDMYGYVASAANAISPFIQGFDLKITTMNDQGYPEISMNTDKWITAVDIMCDLIHANPNTKIGTDAVVADYDNIYKNNQILFYTSTFNFATVLKDMDNDFGIIPMPKWNEAQTEYYTAIGESNTLFGIVSNCKMPDTVAAVMEAMFSESYRTVTPALYETALKVKYSRDDETSMMFDLIMEGVLFNFGSIYTFDMESLNTKFKGVVDQNNKNWVSTVGTFEKSAVNKIAAYIENVKNLES
jgi:hypothetical protein